VRPLASASRLLSAAELATLAGGGELHDSLDSEATGYHDEADVEDEELAVDDERGTGPGSLFDSAIRYSS
jgi:hypothetical protein